jgi:hypothetical protein
MRQPRFGVRKSSDLGLISPWNSHTRDSHRCQEEVCARVLPRLARLRSQQAFEHGQKNTSTCSTRPKRARARPAPEPARPVPRQTMPVSPAPRSRLYALSTSLEHEIAGVCPAHRVQAAARAPAIVDRPTEPFPAPSNPRERLCVPH